MKIAVTGKGGVGKTVIAGTLACLLQKKGFKVLAVDADPNANLAYTLGLKTEAIDQIVPIAENVELIEKKTGAKKGLFGAAFRLNFTVNDIVEKYSFATPCGVSLLVMGVVREAAAGCMCPANHLLRILLRHLLVRREEVVIADMEAGTEHLGRGTAKHVDAMLVVVEPSVKALETAQRVKTLATQMGIEKVFLVGNKLLTVDDESLVHGFAKKSKTPLLSLIHYDPTVREADRSGASLYLSFPSAHAVQEIKVIGDQLLELG